MINHNDFCLETVTVTGYITKDGDEYVIYADSPGGAVVSSKERSEAEKKFIEATRLSFAVRDLNFYLSAVKASDKDKETYAKDLKTAVPKFEFVES